MLDEVGLLVQLVHPLDCAHVTKRLNQLVLILSLRLTKQALILAILPLLVLLHSHHLMVNRLLVHYFLNEFLFSFVISNNINFLLVITTGVNVVDRSPVRVLLLVINLVIFLNFVVGIKLVNSIKILHLSWLIDERP